MLTVSVVVCAFTEDRWGDLAMAFEALGAQTRRPDEVVLVIDHNDLLQRRADTEWGSRVRVVPNDQEPGLSGARNSGVAASSGAVVAFLDDDAVPAADWLEHLLAPFADPRVVAVGGAADPRWPRERPAWWPEEFDWVVGCSYRGLPPSGSDVRNVLGATMALRAEVFERGERFATAVGRVGSTGSGCEETELCIRIRRRWPGARIVLEPRARVLHRVTPARQRFRYFARRCFAEGRSKAAVTDLVGAHDGLSSERAYVRRTLPLGMAEGLRQASRGDLTGLGRAGAIGVGLAVTTAGYAVGGGRRRLADALGPHRPRREAPDGDAGFRPIRLVELDLAAHPPVVSHAPAARPDQEYGRARVLVRQHGRPLGVVEADLELGVLAPHVLESIRTRFDDDADPAGPDHADPMPGGLAASVVIATRDRPADLRRCLDSVLATGYPELEVLVVDNAPGSRATEALVRDEYPGVRYLREDVPGLANAHNWGLAHVTTPVVAFTDDDVVVDRDWVRTLAARFAEGPVVRGRAGGVACVTGLIWPAELETSAQLLTDTHGGFAKGFESRVFDLDRNRPADPLFPYAAGTLGSGANMAFRTDVLRGLGGFDPLLGAGSPGRGGDDLAAFAEVILAGYSLVYEPAAVVHHRHRREHEAVSAQALNYGIGLGAYLTRLAVRRPSVLAEFARLAPRGAAHVLSGPAKPAEGRRDDYPRRLTLLQVYGMARGPWAYLRGAQAAFRTGTAGGS